MAHQGWLWLAISSCNKFYMLSMVATRVEISGNTLTINLVKALSHCQYLRHEIYSILFSTRDFHQHSIWSPWKMPCNTAFIRPQSLVPSLHGRKALMWLNSEV